MQRRLTVVEGMALAQDIAQNWQQIWNFQARKGDVLLDTYPKSGMEEVNAMPSPRILKSHLPVHLVPPSFWRHDCKVIYVARNARDTVTSYYHFDQMLQFHPDPNPWENYLERFMKGEVGWGSWYDHVKGFWEMKEKHQILYIFFEDLKKTPLQQIQKVAHFLGKNLPEETLSQIARLSTFDHMKNNPMANNSDFPKEILNQSKSGFMRKGKVGDWKTMFTVQQNEIFEDDYRRQMEDSSLTFHNPK
ncbi:sulfotransferase 1C4-like isoform X2 [Engystomops pustulosus]|uniref:sulfotransferase 1C4-like isoform X2 n=1 Tax=Engystomops pustulosus TaxID=76066 RepID=UPI003AFAB1D2